MQVKARSEAANRAVRACVRRMASIMAAQMRTVLLRRVGDWWSSTYKARTAHQQMVAKAAEEEAKAVAQRAVDAHLRELQQAQEAHVTELQRVQDAAIHASRSTVLTTEEALGERQR